MKVLNNIVRRYQGHLSIAKQSKNHSVELDLGPESISASPHSNIIVIHYVQCWLIWLDKDRMIIYE